MADIPDAGQVAAITSETLHGVAGLSPAAQTAAMVGLAAIAVVWIWTRRPSPPQAPGTETLTIVVKAMEEQARATADLAGQVEKLVEQNSVIIAELRGGAMLDHALPRDAAR